MRRLDLASANSSDCRSVQGRLADRRGRPRRIPPRKLGWRRTCRLRVPKLAADLELIRNLGPATQVGPATSGCLTSRGMIVHRNGRRSGQRRCSGWNAGRVRNTWVEAKRIRHHRRDARQKVSLEDVAQHDRSGRIRADVRRHLRSAPSEGGIRDLRRSLEVAEYRRRYQAHRAIGKRRIKLARGGVEDLIRQSLRSASGNDRATRLLRPTLLAASPSEEQAPRAASERVGLPPVGWAPMSPPRYLLPHVVGDVGMFGADPDEFHPLCIHHWKQ